MNAQPLDERNLLDRLLTSDLAFTQRPLLTPSEFAQECKRRGTYIHESQLEYFHRHGLLVPFIQVTRTRRYVNEYRRSDPHRQPFEVPFLGFGAQGLALREAHRQRRVSLGKQRRFVSWSRDVLDVDGDAVPFSMYLYSQYQLLNIIWTDRYDWNDRSLCLKELSDTGLGLSHIDLRFQYDQWREAIDRLVPILSLMEPLYYPEVVHGRWTVPQPLSLRDVKLTMNRRDPVQTLSICGLSSDEIIGYAKHLFDGARMLDPLENWSDLVRRVRPQQWNALRGDALLAMDFRIAGEMLMRLHDDLCEHGTAEPLPAPSPYFAESLQYRLKPQTHESLDHDLMSFGLSPQPSVLLIIEGDTEELLIPRVMDLLGIDRSGNNIELRNIGGLDTNIDQLVLHSVLPRLGAAVQKGRLLVRPATKVIILADREGRFRTRQRREQKLDAWTDLVVNEARRVQHVRLDRDDIRAQFEVHVWDETEASFEFANFSDDEITDGIIELSITRQQLQRDDVYHVVGDLRERQRVAERGTNLTKALKYHCGVQIKKTALSEILWRKLEARIVTAKATDSLASIPVARVLQEVAATAGAVLRTDVMVLCESVETG